VTWLEALLALEQGATLVTAGQRLSRVLSDDFDRRQQADGKAVWPTPDILPWNAWLVRAWNRLSQVLASRGEGPPLLLSSAQQMKVWESIIEGQHRGRDLVQPAATADSAIGAWELLHSWIGPLPEYEWQATADTRAYNEWQRTYARLLARHQWLDPALLPDRLLAHDPRLWLDLSQPLLLAGFEELTPLQCRLLDAFRAAGAKVESLAETSDRCPTEYTFAGADTNAEIAAAAHWAAARLAEHPGCSIAVVVPNLGAVRARIERIFSEVLPPERVNISLGLPLVSYPIIFSAFTALRCAEGAVRLEDMGHVLRSPFFTGAARERSKRALADGALRRLGALELPLARTLDEVGRHCPDMHARLKAFRSRLREARPSGTPSYWAHTLSSLLDSLGWPGDRQRTSLEYQTLTRWKSLLGSFAALEVVTPSMRLDEAVRNLRRLSAEDVYQPQTGASGVQVMGLLETSGLSFDYLWVMGLHDEVWPLPASPNAFLPAAAQRRANVPHATAERELHFARETTGRLRRSARHVVWSYPLHEDDRALRPSSLLPDCPRIELPAALPALPTGGPVVDAPDLAAVLPDGPLRGGAGLLQDMSACPFKAYAKRRLGAGALDSPHPGLDAGGRGSLLHDALKFVWRELGGSDALQSPDLPELVRVAVAKAIEENAARAAGLMGRFRELEQERLERLVLEWLQLERQRSPFQVYGVEHERPIRIGPLEMNVRIDRIDRLPGGQDVILDYKTNRKAPSAWDGDRPDEPQIPLYAVTHDAELAAVAFAQVIAGRPAFKGRAATPEVLPGVKAQNDFESMTVEWRQILEALAERFAAGHAVIDPRRGELTCRICDLAPVCRHEERTEIASEDC
jgi:ATP-dependent helicase/nuclease subunit B